MVWMDDPEKAVHHQNGHECDARWLVHRQHEEVEAAKGFLKNPAPADHAVDAERKADEKQNISQRQIQEVNIGRLPGSLESKES